jgi:hypothetical protein
LPHSELLEGNSEKIGQFFQAYLNKPAIKIGYFGDHLMSDVHCAGVASRPGVHWDSFAVVEELAEYDSCLCQGVDPEALAY